MTDSPTNTIPAEILREMACEALPASPDEMDALKRIVEIAGHDTGQSAKCANLLLAWWNAGKCGGFDLTDLWAVDTAIARDMLQVIGLIARQRHYPDVYLDREVFVALVKDWRPALIQE